jgi:hypothetical protein
VFTRVTACMLAESPCATLSTVGFSRFVTSSSATIATGWNDSCRAGFAPAENQRLVTAHYETGSSHVSRKYLRDSIPVTCRQPSESKTATGELWLFDLTFSYSLRQRYKGPPGFS